jgi:hypothetical protein
MGNGEQSMEMAMEMTSAIDVDEEDGMDGWIISAEIAQLKKKDIPL